MSLADYRGGGIREVSLFSLMPHKAVNCLHSDQIQVPKVPTEVPHVCTA